MHNKYVHQSYNKLLNNGTKSNLAKSVVKTCQGYKMTHFQSITIVNRLNFAILKIYDVLA